MDTTTKLLALSGIAELLAKHDAAHLLPAVVTVLDPYLVNDGEEAHETFLSTDAVIWLIGLLDQDINLNTGKALSNLLALVRPFLLGQPEPPELPEVPLGDGSGETLTVIEQVTLRLIASGLTNIQIAERLGGSEDTVKTRVRRIYRKFGVENRAHAVAVGYQLGLLTIRMRPAA